jgi:DME family drug/metabolite transporter
MALGTSANAILLQYSAPLWLYLASIFLLGEPADRRSTLSLFIGLAGIAVIVVGGWTQGELVVILIALGSGLTYAGVLICLRVLRDVSSRWLTVWNHLLGGVVLLPLLLLLRPPTGGQFVVLFLYGALQMGLAYWLVARGLRVVNPQEAGTIMLLEPILNPIWAYLVSPETEVPEVWTFVGGAVILAALAYRYWPVGFNRR